MNSFLREVLMVLRELAGWLLVFAGLFVFYACMAGLASPTYPRIFQAIPYSIIGFVIFRGGIGLIKISVAARVCRQAQIDMQQEANKRPASITRP